MMRRPSFALVFGGAVQAVQFDVEDTTGAPTLVAKTAGVVGVAVLSNLPSLTQWKVQCTARAGMWWVAVAQTAVPVQVLSAADGVVVAWPDFDAGSTVTVLLAQVPIV